jgi:oxygen-independent coproporphyrinogen-3 oxidase
MTSSSQHGTDMRETLGLYVHVPFCELKCSYCDFNSYAGLEGLMGPYVDALCLELELWGQAMGRQRVATVFFGGGTPSLLSLPLLERVLEAAAGAFVLGPGCEVTLEANPGTVDRDYLRGLRSLGVDRLSLGVQSLHDDDLRWLDRLHSAADAVTAYRWAREAGFRSVNLDLIFGLPGQPLERWQKTLEGALALGPDHLSLYALTVEEGTKLAADIARGWTPPPDEDAQAAMYEWSRERLAVAGYEHYEISNWARPGHRSRHNLTYWEGRPYLGVGAGAHSFLTAGDAGLRFADVYSPRQYVRRVEETARRGVQPGPLGDVLGAMRQVAFVEELAPPLMMAEALILGLRLTEGVALATFEERFGVGLLERYGPAVAELMELGLLELSDGHLRLTPRGLLLANEVFVRVLEV